MTLRSQILLLIALPFLALAGLGTWKGAKDWDRYQSAMATHANVQAALQLTDLVHYLQVERGQTAAFLTAGGTRGQESLTAARADVDQALSEISTRSAALPQLAGLEAMRTSATDLKASIPQVATFYTAAIEAVLDLGATSLIFQKDSEVSHVGTGLSAISQAKEAAGLQRAAGVVGLSRAEFAAPAYVVFVQTGATEGGFVNLAQLILQDYLGGVDLAGTLAESGLPQMRAQILEAGAGGTSEVAVKNWFGAATGWLTHLRALERDAAELMTTLSNAAAAEAWRALLLTLGCVILSLLISASIGLRLILSFTKQSRALQEDLNKLARKEFDFTPANLERNNEIGQLSNAMDVTRLALQDSAAKLAAVEENRIAARGTVVGTLEDHLQRLANRDLKCTITEDFPEEYETLRRSFNATVATLQATIQDVVGATTSINTGSSEIRQATSSLAKRTESQAATLEETAAALEEMTNAVRSAADGARNVENTVAGAREEAVRSGEIVQDAVGAMTEIEQSSLKISQIISVIDDIAFQTNLLALNAGVEAARAGDAGRGFAVVASEVRSLAHNSAEAATEIKALIENSNKQVGRGVDLVGNAGTALTSIVGQVNNISELISDIASSAAEQATGLTEINSGVARLDEVTQKNAAMVEETTAAGQLLHADTEALAGMVAQFKTEHQAPVTKSETPANVEVAVQAPTAQPAPAKAPAPTAVRASAATAVAVETEKGWEDF
ncbi:methyl-accepting chemotaxis protein [Shimia sp.]|uniref:methyl-accepting chemotaxis protein n=1 Tax=Shimia sp. TaxID=1954381 RepID=UPI003BA8B7E8